MISRSKISIKKDISIAETLPSFFYTDKDYFDLSIEKIFKNSWQFIIKKSDCSHTILPFDFLEDSISEPLILTKSEKYNIVSNVCTHRGSILCNEKMKRNKIKCMYHGRSFDLKGNLTNAPGFEKTNNFPGQKDNLIHYPIKEWNNFLFCSLNGKIKINSVFDDINIRLKNYPFNKLIFDKKSSNTYCLDAHWALYCENYLEGFHVPFVHKGLNSDINLETYQTELLEEGVLQYTKKRNGNAVSHLCNNVYAYYYWIFPNIMLNFYSWGLSMNIIEPINNKKTKVKFLSFPIKGLKQTFNTPSSLDIVDKEDQDVVLKVQKGISSTSYLRGRYSAEHELGVHHFHRLIAKYLN